MAAALKPNCRRGHRAKRGCERGERAAARRVLSSLSGAGGGGRRAPSQTHLRKEIGKPASGNDERSLAVRQVDEGERDEALVERPGVALEERHRRMPVVRRLEGEHVVGILAPRAQQLDGLLVAEAAGHREHLHKVPPRVLGTQAARHVRKEAGLIGGGVVAVGHHYLEAIEELVPHVQHLRRLGARLVVRAQFLLQVLVRAH